MRMETRFNAARRLALLLALALVAGTLGACGDTIIECDVECACSCAPVAGDAAGGAIMESDAEPAPPYFGRFRLLNGQDPATGEPLQKTKVRVRPTPAETWVDAEIMPPTSLAPGMVWYPPDNLLFSVVWGVQISTTLGAGMTRTVTIEDDDLPGSGPWELDDVHAMMDDTDTFRVHVIVQVGSDTFVVYKEDPP